MENTISYLRMLTTPLSSKAPQAKKVVGIPIDSLVRTLTATNAVGMTKFDRADLGNPMPYAFNKDGAPKFNKQGVPMRTIAKDVRAGGNMLFQNFLATMNAETIAIIEANPDAFKKEVEACQAAASPVVASQNKVVADVIAEQARLEKEAEDEKLLAIELEKEAAAKAQAEATEKARLEKEAADAVAAKDALQKQLDEIMASKQVIEPEETGRKNSCKLAAVA